MPLIILGGNEDWRTVLTIPNILREFNPRLIGFSTGTNSGIKGLNVANNIASSSDLETQVEELISKIKRSSNMNIREDWKVCYFLEEVYKYGTSSVKSYLA